MNDNKRVIGVFCHYAGDNLGEQASIDAVLHNVALLAPHAELRRFPEPRPRPRRRPAPAEVPPVPRDSAASGAGGGRLLRGLKRIYPLVLLVRGLRALRGALRATRIVPETLAARRLLKDVDLLMIVGSNQLFDHPGGPWNFPYALLKWSLAARLAGARLAYVSVGAGPIGSPYSAAMLRQCLRLAHYRSYRDQASKDVLRALGAGADSDGVQPDLAFSMNIRAPAPNPAGAPVVVAINPMAIYDPRYWPDADIGVYDSLVEKFTALTEWLDAQGHRFFFYGSHPKDALLVEEIRRKLGSDREEFTDPDIYPDDVDTLMRRIGRADVAVAMRFHGIVLPFVLEKPVLGIEYWKKTTDLMSYMDQREYLVEQHEFLYARGNAGMQTILDRLARLIERRDEETRVIRARLLDHRAALDAQYREVLALPDPGTGVRHAYG